MDPISKMVQEFLNRWTRFRQSDKARFFRIDTDTSMHRDLGRLLRAIEMSPDNRSPYFIFVHPFCDRHSFYRAAIEKLKSDYELIREGFSKDGVTLGPLAVATTGRETPEESFALWLKGVSDLVKGHLEYLMVIFLPPKIEDKAAWPNSIEAFLAIALSPAVRASAADTPDQLLKALCDKLGRKCLSGRFFVSSSTLQEYLLKVAAGGWAAVTGGAQKPAFQPPKKQSDAPQTGPKVLPPDEAACLRKLMADSAVASAENKTIHSVRALREARTLCKRHGLQTEEAVVLLAIGNNFLAAQKDRHALSRYRRAELVAAAASASAVVTQALMAAGATLFRMSKYEHAARTYQQAAEAAQVSQSELLRLEALRMAGTCHNLNGQPRETVRCWNEALGTGEKMSATELSHSTFEQVGQAFVDLCRKHGLHEQARSVHEQIQALKQKAELTPRAEVAAA
jgi:hypothetical protein